MAHWAQYIPGNEHCLLVLFNQHIYRMSMPSAPWIPLHQALPSSVIIQILGEMTTGTCLIQTYLPYPTPCWEEWDVLPGSGSRWGLPSAEMYSGQTLQDC